MFVTLRLRGGDYPEFTGLYASFLGVWQQAREKIKSYLTYLSQTPVLATISI